MFFLQLKDEGHYAEALMTKGVLAPRGSMVQLKVSPLLSIGKNYSNTIILSVTIVKEKEYTAVLRCDIKLLINLCKTTSICTRMAISCTSAVSLTLCSYM